MSNDNRRWVLFGSDTPHVYTHELDDGWTVYAGRVGRPEEGGFWSTEKRCDSCRSVHYGVEAFYTINIDKDGTTACFACCTGNFGRVWRAIALCRTEGQVREVCRPDVRDAVCYW
jgi:hypothetical protein